MGPIPEGLRVPPGLASVTAVDALENGDDEAFAANRAAGVANLTDALNAVVELGAPRCDPSP